MWTGKQTLHSISEALQTANSDVEQLDQALSQLTFQLTDNRREQTRACQQLATLRLNAIESEPLTTLLNQAEKQARETLQTRKHALGDLEKRIAEHQQVYQTIEVEREQASELTAKCAQAVIDCETLAQQALEQDSNYQAQLHKTQQADAIADSAEEKTQQAQQDRQHKGKPYEADPLFIYLWQRHYTTPDYEGKGIIRTLDAWVARLCEFSKARVNYWMLLELPKRLSDHAEKVRAEADAELAALSALEAEEATKHGVVEAQQALAAQEEVLARVDEQLAKTEQQIDELQQQRARFSAGEDLHFQQALGDLSRVMQQHGIPELQALSNRTLTTEDDQWVAAIADLREEERELQTDINEHRRRQEMRLQRRRELEDIRNQFKRQRYDDVRSGFSNGGLISIALNEFLKGVVNNRELWRTIERYQRHRDVGAWPDFGSGGLGGRKKRRHPKKGQWHWPGSRGGFKLPRSGGSRSRGRGNGGFRTGGGF